MLARKNKGEGGCTYRNLQNRIGSTIGSYQRDNMQGMQQAAGRSCASTDATRIENQPGIDFTITTQTSGSYLKS